MCSRQFKAIGFGWTKPPMSAALPRKKLPLHPHRLRPDKQFHLRTAVRHPIVVESTVVFHEDLVLLAEAGFGRRPGNLRSLVHPEPVTLKGMDDDDEFLKISRLLQKGVCAELIGKVDVLHSVGTGQYDYPQAGQALLLANQ